MKRFFKCLIFTLVAVLTLSLAACKKHEHDPQAEWKRDSATHWHPCSGCDELIDASVHTYGEWVQTTGKCEKTRVCTVCDFKQTQTYEHEYVDGVCEGCGDKLIVTQYYVKGTFNDWQDLDEYKLVLDGATYTASLVVTLTEGDKFKVADPEWKEGHTFGFGNESLVHEEGLFEGSSEEVNSDIVVLKTGEYKIVVSDLNKNFHTVTITLNCEHIYTEVEDVNNPCHFTLTCSKCQGTKQEVKHTYGDDVTCDKCGYVFIYPYFVRGNFTNDFAIHNDYRLVYDETTKSSSITLNIVGGDAFKIAGEDWMAEGRVFGFDANIIPTGAFIADDSGNFFSISKGKFKFTVSGLDSLTHTLTIEAIGDYEADEVHTNLPELYLRGEFGGVAAWDPTSSAKFEVVNGQLVFVKELKVGDTFKIATAEWDGEGTHQFHGKNTTFDSTLFAPKDTNDKPDIKVLVAGTYKFVVTNGFTGLKCVIVKDGEAVPNPDQGSQTPSNPNQGGSTPSNPDQGGNSGSDQNNLVVLYFENNWLWTDVRFYVFDANGTYAEAWPGTAPTKVGTNDGHDVYKIEISKNYTTLIISGIKNDGSGYRDQTPNIAISSLQGNLLSMLWADGNNVNVGNYTPSN